VFEVEDYRADDAVVTAFKKVSTNNAKKGKARSSYVSSFPFSGHSRVIDGVERMPPIEDGLPNQESLLGSVQQATMGAEEQDAEIAANPFVFLLNRAKMESFKEQPEPGRQGEETVLRIPKGFSYFNK